MVTVEKGKISGKSVYGIPDGRYYSIDEYCAIYNLSDVTVRKWKERGQIRAVVIFGKNYIPDVEPPFESKKGRKKW